MACSSHIAQPGALFCCGALLRLRWHDYMLVQTAEQAPDSKHFREKNTFVTTRMKPGESWNEAWR
eukprot:4157822-Amphidinium_carterae.1